MTAEESRGRKITLGIALFVGIPPLLVLAILLLTGAPASGIPWFQIVLPVVLASLLYLGYKWARAYIIFSLFAGALLLVLGPLLGGNLLVAFVSMPFAVAYVVAAIVLWKSKSIEAYFDGQTRARDVLPSLKDLDGV